VTPAQVEEQVRQAFLSRIGPDGSPTGDVAQQIEAAKSLYDTLVRPAEAFLQKADRVIICPDGHLRYLPFEALICGKREGGDGPFEQCSFWGERYAISYTPAATLLKGLGQNAGGELTTFAAPDVETSTGPQMDLAIARTLTFGGAPCALMRLWTAGDEAEAALMAEVNRRIGEGQTKAVAVAEAKRGMINDAEHPDLRDPFIWAPLVLYGESGAG